MLAEQKRRFLDWLAFKVGCRWGWRRHMIEMPESIWSSDEVTRFMAETMPGRARGFKGRMYGPRGLRRHIPSHVMFQTEADKVAFALRFSEELRALDRQRRELAAMMEAAWQAAGVSYARAAR